MSSSKVIKDPVCGMSVNEIFSVSAEHKGKKYYFCGDSCQKRFIAEPDSPAWEK